MNAQTLFIDRTEAEMTELRSLAELNRARHERLKARKAEFSEARRPTSPLAVKVSEVVKQPKPAKKAISVEVLEHCDAILNAAERLAVLSPLDAIPTAKSLLAVLLRLAWVRTTGKVLTNPTPDQVPTRLFQKHVVTKVVMRRLHHAMNKPTTASNLLECCKALMQWLASEPDEVMS